MHPFQILVVGSDPERARMLAAPLRAAGHLVAAEADRAAAGDDLQAPSFDAAVVDLQLPGLDRGLLARAITPVASTLPPEPLDVIERRHILATLEFTGGNKRRAAHLLGIARSTLIQKVRRYGAAAE
jgi:DNA-binding NtrC family response regulator